MRKQIKKIVTIGGGSGQYELLAGLRDIGGIKISAIVSMADSGGSTGRLRDELGILPPGDVLKCLLALSPDRESARRLLQRRFSGEGKLNGHNAGNFLLAALAQYANNFPAGVVALGEILDVRGKVLPVTTDPVTLVAELDDGSRIFGEAAIDIPRGDQPRKSKKVFLVPHHREAVNVYSPVVEAIAEADLIAIGPGDLFTSIAPNFLVPGVKEAVRKNKKARLVFAVNIMTKFGETDGFAAKDFVLKAEELIDRKIDFVLVNNQKPSVKMLRKYEQQKATLVKAIEADDWDGRRIIREGLIKVAGGIIRHDSEKLARLISGLAAND